MKKLTVLIPAYNEENGIKQVLHQVLEVCGKDDEIIVVDDGSTDNTANVVRSVSGVRLICHRKNYGYGAAIKTGVVESSGDWICFFDADGQHRNTDIRRLLDTVKQADVPMVVGSRGKKGFLYLQRAPGKMLLHAFAILLTKRLIPDLNSGLRIVHRETLQCYLHLLPDGFSASTTMTMIMLCQNYGIHYIDIETAPRIGKSHVRQMRDGFRTIITILRMIMMFNPLSFFLPISVFLFVSGSVYGVYKLVQTNYSQGLSVGSLLVLLLSVITFFFGMLYDQISCLRLERIKPERVIRTHEREES